MYSSKVTILFFYKFIKISNLFLHVLKKTRMIRKTRRNWCWILDIVLNQNLIGLFDYDGMDTSNSIFISIHHLLVIHFLAVEDVLLTYSCTGYEVFVFVESIPLPYCPTWIWQMTDRASMCASDARTALERPGEDAQIVAKTWPQEFPINTFPEPIHVKNLRSVL